MKDEERKNDTPVEGKETVEDKLDELVYRAENAVYGEKKSLDEDIPATMHDENGYRKLNKYATRKNLGKSIIKHFPKIAFFAITIAFIVGFILLIKSFF